MGVCYGWRGRKAEDKEEEEDGPSDARIRRPASVDPLALKMLLDELERDRDDRRVVAAHSRLHLGRSGGSDPSVGPFA